MKMALTEIPGQIEKLIKNHATDLEEAWANIGDESLSISFPVKIGFKNDRPFCEVGVTFVKEKVKDSITFEWNDKQLSLLKKEA